VHRHQREGTARVLPARASVQGTHILLDYENLQQVKEQLCGLVPDAGNA